MRGLSLHRKIPLFASSLAAGALLVAGVLVYREVYTSSLAASISRLASVAHLLAEVNIATRSSHRLMAQETASSSLVQQALSGGEIDSLALTRELTRLRGAATPDLPVVLIDNRGERVFQIGRSPPMELDREPDPVVDSSGVGTLQQVGDDFLYWTTTPVVSPDGDQLGTLAERRRIADPEAGSQIQALVGSGIRIALGQPGHDVWANIGGEPRAAPRGDFPIDEPFHYTRRDGSVVLATAQTLGPWIAFFEMPMEVVMARPRAFLHRMLAFGAILMLATVIVSWLLSRRLTDPLIALASAADAMAEGNYGRRVRAEGADELARLGRAFNSMAEQVAQSDEALRQRLTEARSLSLRLVEANIAAEHARDEAQAANRAKSSFLATMSHELRTPINAVIGYTELLNVGIPDAPTPRQREFLDRIDRSTRLLTSLVSDVLDLSRIESGQIRVGSAPGSMDEAIRAAVEAIEPEAARKGVDLSVEPGKPCRFQGDQRRVQQILLNLLSNAVKFTPSGGAVMLRCHVDGDGASGAARGVPTPIRIDVEDTGIGIGPHQLSEIFEPFVQAEPGLTREYRGVGLGLAISRRLARMMSGDITVTSTPGRGSRFTLWLKGAVDERSLAG